MANRRKGMQKGPQQHAEGQHGDKAHNAFIEQLHSGSARGKQQDKAEPGPRKGGSHIFEDREQHDEADKNADKHRLAREMGRTAEGDLRYEGGGRGT